MLPSENQTDLITETIAQKRTKTILALPVISQTWILIILGFTMVSLLGLLFFFNQEVVIKSVQEGIFTNDFLLYMLVGFLAQTIDGALGMAYGISSTTFLMSVGVSPAAASASVHIAEIFTSGVSGLSHLRFKNVNKKLFRSLVIPGVLGAILGAYILTSIDGKQIKPFIAGYLLLMGGVIIAKALKKKVPKKKTKNIIPLAAVGGFVDAIGGGGWGPVVASTLIGNGRNAKYTIGSVNLAEFFIAVAGAGTFTIMMGVNNFIITLGLLIGGVAAAPFGAYICNKINTKVLMVMVGILIILLSIRTIVTYF
ncbi:MAG: sulfite exporter TauE/SafE family protein [Verrucomicrobia bacterium]|nr:sulfite exporter TauE/SafE family protein [Cytophagales bacterium]